MGKAKNVMLNTLLWLSSSVIHRNTKMPPGGVARFQTSIQADFCAVTEEEILYCEKGSKCEGGKA